MTLTNNYQYIGRSNAVFNYGSAYYYYLLLYAKTQGDTATGKHKVSVKMRLACSIDVYFSGYNTSGYAKVAGTSAVSWSAQPKPNAEWSKNLTEGGVTYPRWIDLGEGSVDVSTGFGAAKDVKLEASFQRLDMASPPAFVPQTTPMTLSATVTLPALAGASVPTVSASSVAMGSAVTINTNRKSSSFTHKLTYAFGSATGTIAENVGDSFKWTPPLDLASQIPNVTSGKATITCTTYNGSTPVGSASVDITLTVPDNASTKPTVSMTLTPISSLGSAFSGLYIQNLTKVDGKISASGKYGASIKSTQFAPSGYLTQTGDVTVTAKATDSRGYVGSTSQTITVIPYSKPAVLPASGQSAVLCGRCNEEGSFIDAGTYLRIVAKRSYSTITADGVQKNFCTMRFRVNGGDWQTLLSPTNTNNEVDTVIPGVTLSLTEAYSVEIGVVDDIGNTASITKSIPTDKVDIHLREGGGGIAFGKYSTKDGFECAMDAYFSGQTYRVADDGSVEWFFPPMEPGVEYRTAERFRNKPVYAKLLELDTMPNTAFAYMPFATGNSTEVISLTASAIRISDGFTRSLPFFDNGGTCNAVIGVNTQSGQVEVKTLYDFSGFKCTAVVRYIKN